MGKNQKKQKQRGALVPSDLNFIKKISGRYQTRERERDQPHILHMSKLKTTLGLSLYGNHETLRSIRERIRGHCC